MQDWPLGPRLKPVWQVEQTAGVAQKVQLSKLQSMQSVASPLGRKPVWHVWQVVSEEQVRHRGIAVWHCWVERQTRSPRRSRDMRVMEGLATISESIT